jgi:hypothetical protein
MSEIEISVDKTNESEKINTDLDLDLELDLNLDLDSNNDNDNQPSDQIGFLKTDWLQEMETYVSEYGSFYIDDVFQIKVAKIFVDLSNTIQHVSCEKIDLENKNVITNKELQFVNRNISKQNNKTYKLGKCYLYNINIDPEKLVSFLEKDDIIIPFKEVSLSQDIQISPTIIQFQKLNTLYLFFNEVDYITKQQTKKRKKHLSSSPPKQNMRKTRKRFNNIE